MSVHFASSSIIDFTTTGTVLVNTSTSALDANYSDASIRVDGNALATINAAWSSKLTDIWVSFYLDPSIVTGGTGKPWLVFKDGVTEFARIYHKDATNKLVLQTKISGTWTDLHVIGWFLTSGDDCRMSFRLTVSETTGSVRVYQNTALVGTAGTGLDTTGDLSITGCDSVDVYAPSASSVNDHYISEVIVADEDSRDWRVFSKNVNAAGTNSDFTGTYADVDDDTVNDSDFISSTTAAQISTFNFPNLTADNLLPKAVFINSRSRRGATGPQNLQHALRTNAANYTAATQTLETAFQNKLQDKWEVNPNTSAAWTRAEIDALEIGVKSIT